jgi:hypothetical protein
MGRHHDPDAMTCPEPERDDERTAKRLVRLCLGDVEVCRHDDGSRPGMYDLELRWPNGDVEAMEVTRATSATLRHVGHQFDRQGLIAAAETTRSWIVHLAADTTDVRSVRAKIDHQLRQVELAGFTTFAEREEAASVAVARVRRRLGVDSAWSYEAIGEQPRIRLTFQAQAVFIRAEAVNAVVEDQALRNADKLARSGRTERHLFVLVDFGATSAWLGLLERDPPATPPQLPEAVTTVWAASSRADRSPIVWRIRRAGHWEVLL